MKEISAELVKQLRDATNVSMMECKKALMDANGDIEQAKKILRERGLAVAARKSVRATNQGRIATASTEDGRIMSLVEVNCETDFVARNERFINFAKQVAIRACSTDTSLADAMKSDVTTLINETGENIVIKRNVRFILQGTGKLASYIHAGGKIGVLVEAGCSKLETVNNSVFQEAVKDITLHVAASAPKYLEPKDVPETELNAEREIYARQVKDKPPAVINKIVEGKLKKYFTEVCLLEQMFVKDPKISVKDFLKSKSVEVNDTIVIRRFIRYQVGE